MIDLIHNPDEEIFRLYQVYKGRLVGLHYRPPLVNLLITTKCLYFVKFQNDTNSLTLDKEFSYSSINHIAVSKVYFHKLGIT